MAAREQQCVAVGVERERSEVDLDGRLELSRRRGRFDRRRPVLGDEHGDRRRGLESVEVTDCVRILLGRLRGDDDDHAVLDRRVSALNAHDLQVGRLAVGVEVVEQHVNDDDVAFDRGPGRVVVGDRGLRFDHCDEHGRRGAVAVGVDDLIAEAGRLGRGDDNRLAVEHCVDATVELDCQVSELAVGVNVVVQDGDADLGAGPNRVDDVVVGDRCERHARGDLGRRLYEDRHVGAGLATLAIGDRVAKGQRLVGSELGW